MPKIGRKATYKIESRKEEPEKVAALFLMHILSDDLVQVAQSTNQLLPETPVYHPNILKKIIDDEISHFLCKQAKR